MIEGSGSAAGQHGRSGETKNRDADEQSRTDQRDDGGLHACDYPPRTVVTTSIAAVISYLAAAAGVAFLARALGRELPRGILSAVVLLPLLLFFRGLASDQTLLPSDHGALLTPWWRGGYVAPRNPFLQDVTTQYLPWAKAVRDAWLSGEVPWRDRWNGCGTPLAANGLSAAFSPLVLAFLILPLARAFALAAAVKLLLALAGGWLWLRELGASRGSSLFGSVAFSLSFAMFPWIFYVQSGVVCLWPWSLFALELLGRKNSGRRGFWLLAAVAFLMTLQGHVESVAMGASFAVVFLSARLALRDLALPSSVFRGAAGATLLALSLGAFLLLPQALAILASNRLALVSIPYWTPIFSWKPHGPHWPAGFLTTLFPRALGDGIGSPMLAGNISTYPEMAMGHIGVVGWSAALLAFRPGSKRKPVTWSLALPAAAGLCIATGTWPFAEIQGHVPLLRLLSPVRFLSWEALAGSALAALELDRLRRDLSGSRRPALFAAGLAAGLILAALAAYAHFAPAYRESGGLAAERTGLVLSCGALGLFAAAVAGGGGRRAGTLAYLLAAAAGAELSWQGLRQYEYGPSAELFPPTPLVRFLQAQPRPFRVLGEGAELYPNTNVFAGVEDVRTHDAVERRDYVEFLNATCGYPPANYIKFVRDLDAPALDFLNVRYLVCRAGRGAPGQKWRPVYEGADGTVFENRHVLPRVFAPARIVTTTGKAPPGGWVRNAFERFHLEPSGIPPGNDWASRSFLLGTQAGEISNGPAQIDDFEESTNEISFRVRCAGPVTLVASLVQDGGWRARDDRGRPVETALANGPFLGLRVGPGERRITLRYVPPGLRTGAAISGSTLAVLLLAGLLRRLRARNAASRRS